LQQLIDLGYVYVEKNANNRKLKGRNIYILLLQLHQNRAESIDTAESTLLKGSIMFEMVSNIPDTSGGMSTAPNMANMSGERSEVSMIQSSNGFDEMLEGTEGVDGEEQIAYTDIFVLEHTKEIGILRAINALKHNI
jgi:hypothetical protein